MARTLIAAALMCVAVVATADVSAQGPARTGNGAATLPLGWSTAPRPDAARLPFPRNLLQGDVRFGIDLRLTALPGGVLLAMAVLGIVTLRLAYRSEPR